MGLVWQLNFEAFFTACFSVDQVYAPFLWAKASDFIFLPGVPYISPVSNAAHTNCSVVLAQIWAVHKGAPFREQDFAFDHDVRMAKELKDSQPFEKITVLS